MRTIFVETRERMNAEERYLIRRAAQLLGVSAPPEAQRKYLSAVPVRYWMPPGYEPTRNELAAVRKLCRDSGRTIPDWAQVGYPQHVKANQLNFWPGPGGALMCSQEIPGITQDLTGEETAEWYGGRYFVGETLSKGAMKRIADALGGVFQEGSNDGGSEGSGGNGE